MKERNRFIASTIIAAMCAALFAYAPARAGSFEMALKHHEQANYEQALRYFKRAASEDAANPNIHYYMADTYVRLNQLAQAQAEYQKVMALAPGSQAARLSKEGLAQLKTYYRNRYQVADSNRGNGFHKVSYSSGSAAGNLSGGDPAENRQASGEDKLTGFNPRGEDYFDLVNDGGLYIRWALDKMPLKIYVESSPQGVSHFSPGFVSYVYRAMDVWSQAAGGQISYVPTNIEAEADIRVKWTDTFDSQGHKVQGGIIYTAGLTRPSIIRGELKYMTVLLSTLDITGAPQPETSIYGVAVHELGHALGLMGHSPDEGDIMHANAEGTRLSQRDLNTLHKLYMTQAHVTNKPLTDPDAIAQRNETMFANVDEQIQRSEAAVKRQPTGINWLNLGVAYLRKGGHLVERRGRNNDPKDKGGALYWFRRALFAMHYAIEKEPQNSRAYQYRGAIYNEMGQHEKALADTERALQINPRDTESHFQKSVILANMGQKSAAASSLKNYLAHDPAGRSTDRVKRLEKRISQM